MILTQADIDAIAAAVWEHMERATTEDFEADVVQVNDVPITGTGQFPADPWRPA